MFGVLVTGCALIVMQMDGTLFQIIYTFFGVVGGPLLGMFVLGIFLPWSNTKVSYFVYYKVLILLIIVEENARIEFRLMQNALGNVQISYNVFLTPSSI